MGSMKPYSRASKFKIYTKALAATCVYHSLCWVPSTHAYAKLEKPLKNFLWPNSNGAKVFIKLIGASVVPQK